jgi:hypothetical protein
MHTSLSLGCVGSDRPNRTRVDEEDKKSTKAKGTEQTTTVSVHYK